MGRSRPDLRVSAAAVWELMSEDPLTPERLASVSVQSEPPSSEGGPPDGQQRPHRRRRRRRRRGGRGGGPHGNGAGVGERSEDLAATGPERPVDGVLYIPPKENASGVLVSAKANYLPSPKDPLVPRELIQREGLEAGALIAGYAADGGRPVLRRVETVEGMEPGAFRQRPAFTELVSIDPHEGVLTELFRATGLEKETSIVPLAPAAGAEALLRGEIDCACMMTVADDPIVKRLLADDRVRR